MTNGLTYTALILAATMTASCDRSDPAAGGLLTLNSRTEQVRTRASAQNAWDGGEKVRVRLDGTPAVTFTATADGKLTPTEAIWWQNATQTVSARAWYPDRWIFPTDQSEGIQRADFIFAPTVSGITFRNAASNPLTFRHKTAKVTMNLTAGEGVGSVEGAKIVLFGHTSGAVDTSEAGGGVIIGYGDGWITPRNNGGGVYSALMIPRRVEGAHFIKITLAGFDYYYTPAAGEADLKAERSYTYNITVQKDRLDVTVGGGMTWTGGGEHEVTGEIEE